MTNTENTLVGSQSYSEIDPTKSAKTFQRIKINDNNEKDRQGSEIEIKQQDRPHTYPFKYPNNTK
jgi:hypothetical protein